MTNENRMRVEEMWNYAASKANQQSGRRLHPVMRFFKEELPPEDVNGEPLYRLRFGRIALAAGGMITGLVLFTQAPQRPKAPQVAAVQTPVPVRRPMEVPSRTNQQMQSRMAAVLGPPPQTPTPVMQVPVAQQVPQAYPIPPIPVMAARTQYPSRLNASLSSGERSQQLQNLLALRSEEAPIYIAEESKSTSSAAIPTLQTSISSQQFVAKHKVSAGTMLQARLPQGLAGQVSNSTPVIAEVSQPLTEGNEVIVPTGSRLVGTVSGAAGGRVEISFSVLVTPDNVEHKIEGAIAITQGAVGVVAQITDNRSPDGFSALGGNVLAEIGQQMTQPLSTYSYGGFGTSAGSVTNAPIDQRVLGSLLKAGGTTLQQGSQYQRQLASSQPMTFKTQVSDIQVLLTKGASL